MIRVTRCRIGLWGLPGFALPWVLVPLSAAATAAAVVAAVVLLIVVMIGLAELNRCRMRAARASSLVG